MHFSPNTVCSIAIWMSPSSPTRSGPIFRQVSQKCKNCLLTSYRHLPLCELCGGTASAIPPDCRFLHDYSECFCSSFRASCLASSNHQFLLGSVFFSDEKETFLYVHPALLFGQFNENINKAQTGEGEGGAQSLGSVISILHNTTSFCTWAINTAINTTMSWRNLIEAGKCKRCLPLKIIVRSI